MKRSKRIALSSKPDRPRRKRQTIGELKSLQRLMGHVVMRPLVAGRKMNPRWIDGSPTSRIVACFIKPNARLTSLERLQLYNRQYWFRLLDCFHEDFPGLRTVLGERRFGRLAEIYLSAHPSESFTMRNLGSRLVRFVEENPKRVAPCERLALDMARLEWAHIEAFDNAAEPVLTSADLMGADPGKLRLKLQPYLTLLRIDHALDDFLIKVRRRKGLRGEASNAVPRERLSTSAMTAIQIRTASIHLAVHRYQNSVFYKRLRPVQFALLSALHRGLSLEDAITDAISACELGSIHPAELSKWFQDWSALGWFSRNAPCQFPPDRVAANRRSDEG